MVNQLRNATSKGGMCNPSVRSRWRAVVGAQSIFILALFMMWAPQLEAVERDLVAFDPEPVRLSPSGEGYIDPEILQIDARMVFQTGGGDVWIAELDPATGLFLSTDGKDSLVDTGAAPIAGDLERAGVRRRRLGVERVLRQGRPARGGAADLASHSVRGPDHRAADLGDQHQTQLATTSLTRTGTRVLNIRGTWSNGTMTWFSESDPDDERPIIDIDDSVFGRTPRAGRGTADMCCTGMSWPGSICLTPTSEPSD